MPFTLPMGKFGDRELADFVDLRRPSLGQSATCEKKRKVKKREAKLDVPRTSTEAIM